MAVLEGKLLQLYLRAIVCGRFAKEERGTTLETSIVQNLDNLRSTVVLLCRLVMRRDKKCSLAVVATGTI